MIHCRCGSTDLDISPEPGGLIPRYWYHCRSCNRLWSLTRWVVDAMTGDHHG